VGSLIGLFWFGGYFLAGLNVASRTLPVLLKPAAIRRRSISACVSGKQEYPLPMRFWLVCFAFICGENNSLLKDCKIYFNLFLGCDFHDDALLAARSY
jgi:hypothetical protein